ncbi:MAG: CDP-alcohol phosphatidyltransferase family protein [Patescibacteria group bacterium]|nr:CDP-alcohol phosphatidyltransferase family protein [Patescibacteria group bacterium]
MLGEIRNKFKFLEDFLGNVFSKIGLTPNQFTLTSLLFALLSFYFLIKFNFLFAFIFFISAGILDLIDGAVARKRGEVSKKGAYLDTIIDRYVEIIILLGFLLLPLQKIAFPSYVWIFLSLAGSIMTTYSKAAAKEKELIYEEMKAGFFGRTERMVLISFAIFLGIFNLALVIYPIVILAIFSNLSAVQRVYLTFKSAQN